MNRSFYTLAIFFLAMCATQASAQGRDENGEPIPDKAAGLADEHDPLLAHWKSIFEVHLPAKVNGPNLALNVPTMVFGTSKGDRLSDLRLVDANGKHAHYVMRVLQGESRPTDVPISRQFNVAPSPKHKRFELNLELSNVPAAGHNEIMIMTTGLNYRRKVEVFGDTSDQFTNPRLILGKDKYLVKYEIDGQTIDIHRLHYEPQQFRFLQVYVYADGDEEIPTITQVLVRRSINVPGEFVTEQASFDDKAQQVRADGGPGSAWFINLPGEGMVPCQKLKFDIASPPTQRPFRLEFANPNQPPVPIGNAQWLWTTENGNQYLEISFPEVFARRLRFVVTDNANEPLYIKNVQATRAVRQMVFAAPEEGKYALPLKLFAGNPNVGQPNYDQAPKVLPETKFAPPFAELGDVRQNPAWVPPPPTLNERVPWLVYVVLGAACLILLAILGGLARQAIQRHDQAQASPAPGQ